MQRSDGVATSNAALVNDFRSRFPETWAALVSGIERGLHTGGQFCCARRGQVLGQCAFGEAEPGRPMTVDHALFWLSGGKPVTAFGMAKLWQDGRVALDEPVARWIPEFAAAGKGGVTLRHLLTHTAGLRHVDCGWPEQDWADTITRICESPLEVDWVPGESAGYHTQSSWFLLGEIIQRVTGQTFSGWITETLLRPLGIDRLTFARPQPDSDQRIDSKDTLVISGAEDRPQQAWMWGRDRGELKPRDWHLSPRTWRPSPGSSLMGPAVDVVRFYNAVLAAAAGQSTPRGTTPLWEPPTIEAVISRHRVGEFDQTLQHVVDFGLGVIIDSKRYGPDTVPYGYGAWCSGRTFGHGGSQSSLAFADPVSGIVVAYAFNCQAGEGQHQRRAREVNAALGLDLSRLVD